jgi:hypothetical protein
MNKQELVERLARRLHRTQENTADKLDSLVHKLWKEARELKLKEKEGRSHFFSRARAKAAGAKKS